MTKKDAIEELETLSDDLSLSYADEEYRNKIYEAIAIAIKSLKKDIKSK